jgi:multidrug transporter EmrE-like cation transporter
MIGAYAIGLAFYAMSVWLSYSAELKSSKWYFPIGILLAIVCNFLWLYVAKHSDTKHAIYMNALLWDSMIVGSYAIIPVLLFGVRFSTVNLFGVVLVIFGIVLTKV